MSRARIKRRAARILIWLPGVVLAVEGLGFWLGAVWLAAKDRWGDSMACTTLTIISWVAMVVSLRITSDQRRRMEVDEVIVKSREQYQKERGQ